MNTQRAPLASDSSRLMSCRSTRSCRSSCCSSDNSTCKSDFHGSMLAIASLNVFSTDWRSVSLQRRMKGNSARLRASRMRLEMTISLCGPEPRSHSPHRLAISSSLCELMLTWPLGRSLAFALRWPLFLFQLADLIANFGRLLVMLLLLGLVHLAPQANQFGVVVRASFMSAWPLAAVLRLAMNVGNQRRQ